MSLTLASGPLRGTAVAAALVAAFSVPPLVEDPAAGVEGAATFDCRVSAPSPVDAGRYLVQVAGCNDCHTPGWMERGRAVPEQEWLTGVPVGWRGPWGTSYASNLRRFADETPLDVWLAIGRDRATHPPMPWENLHAMNPEDFAAIHAYLRHLGPAGEKMPAYCQPGVEPETPVFLLDPGEVGFRRVYAEPPRAGLADAAGEGVFEALGLAVRVRVPSRETRDACSLVELGIPPQAGTPVHTLLHHDQVIEVLEGELELRLAGSLLAAEAGDRVVVPRGTPLVLRNAGSRNARVQVTGAPGGYDEWLEELAELGPEPDADELLEVHARYGAELAAR